MTAVTDAQTNADESRRSAGKAFDKFTDLLSDIRDDEIEPGDEEEVSIRLVIHGAHAMFLLLIYIGDATLAAGDIKRHYR